MPAHRLLPVLAALSLSCGGDPEGGGNGEGGRCSNGEERSYYNGPEGTEGPGP